VEKVGELGGGICLAFRARIGGQDWRTEQRIGGLDIAIAGEIAAGDQDDVCDTLAELA
jgi:hypothetical protein